MSLNRKMKRQQEKQLRSIELPKKKEMAQSMIEQVKAKARMEADQYYKHRLINDVPKIKGIGPKLYKEICTAMGFDQIKE